MVESAGALVVLLPPDPPPGLPPDAASALALGVLLDAVDALAGPAIDLRVAVDDPFSAPLVAALLPPGVAVEGAPSRSPRAWHLAHRLPGLAHSG